jgi:hypothetical protein
MDPHQHQYYQQQMQQIQYQQGQQLMPAAVPSSVQYPSQISGMPIVHAQQGKKYITPFHVHFRLKQWRNIKILLINIFQR